MPSKPKRYRSAITGRFVSAKYAAAHLKTTVAERDKTVRTKSSKKK